MSDRKAAPDTLRTKIAAAELVCFDNDGTIFRSDEVANPAIQRTFRKFMAETGLDYPEPTDERILDLTGSPGPVFYKSILPPELADRSEEFRALCIEEEVVEIAAHGRFFDGVEDLLQGLREKGKRIALVSNGGTAYIEACARKLDYARLLDGIYHYGKYDITTKAGMITAARERFGAETAVMVGDRGSDLEGARGAGVPFVGCGFGYAAAEEIAGTEVLVSSVSELREVLLPGGCVA